jgi:hypothetical protein
MRQSADDEELYQETVLYRILYLEGIWDRSESRFPFVFLSTPIWIRTRNLRFRRPMLYPIELWVLVQEMLVQCFAAFSAI